MQVESSHWNWNSLHTAGVGVTVDVVRGVVPSETVVVVGVVVGASGVVFVTVGRDVELIRIEYYSILIHFTL